MHAEIIQDITPNEAGDSNELHELQNPVGFVTNSSYHIFQQIVQICIPTFIDICKPSLISLIFVQNFTRTN